MNDGRERCVKSPSLSRDQIDWIARQEGADPQSVEEALRRMRSHPDVRDGRVRSPGAFFRGVLRGVLLDRYPGTMRSDPDPDLTPEPPGEPVPSPTSTDASHNRTYGQMALRAWTLFDTCDHDESAVRRCLRREFPSAPADLIVWALNNGRALHKALPR